MLPCLVHALLRAMQRADCADAISGTCEHPPRPGRTGPASSTGLPACASGTWTDRRARSSQVLQQDDGPLCICRCIRQHCPLLACTFGCVLPKSGLLWHAGAVELPSSAGAFSKDAPTAALTEAGPARALPSHGKVCRHMPRPRQLPHCHSGWIRARLHASCRSGAAAVHEACSP